MEVYGDSGYVIAANNTTMRLRNRKTNAEQTIQVTAKDIAVYEDPFSYFADVIRGKIKVEQNGVYSLENNITVVRILDAARESAKTGKTVMLKK
jgi:predicted dehydrogenase